MKTLYIFPYFKGMFIDLMKKKKLDFRTLQAGELLILSLYYFITVFANNYY